MVLSRLDIHRRNRGEQTLVTLVGTIGPATVPLLRAALEQCLRDGVTVIDVDLATVGSCDAKGLDVFLGASRRADRVHASLRLHHPCAQITRLLSATGSTPALLAAPTSPAPPELFGDLRRTGTRTPDEPVRGSDQPVLKDGIRLRRLSRWQVEGVREDIADLAMASVAGTPGEAFHDRADFVRRLAVSAHRPGFALLVAETTVLVGCAYGFPVGPDGSGRRGFDRTLQESIQRLTACARFVVLTQVVAHPHAQHRDIARRLQQRLLTDRRAVLGVALLHPFDQAGQAAFESWGWQNFGEIIGLPGPVAPCVLVLPSATAGVG
ncbi:MULTISPECIES: STAS domain-containing protein [unclassified Streptomyces]|uniref:STAS domain-containing protein n=1 Tax=unclassified Streptomyces TaxID=2593676 RepID=UPI002365BB43|nr:MULTISPECIES: STAS domain-containing protein [unclassified Streptomyces]MDF3140104.1 STAS domain-containing protein [Streptomyces sp. T21Q-yed]WDF40132.1 STAS domain-containing protein [Streptomyces sp. T12]